MLNGGYIMFDAEGVDLTSDSTQTKAGMFNKLKKVLGANKPVFAYNVNWGTGSNKYLTPLPVFVQQWSSTLIVLTCSILKVEVTNEDVITVTSLVG